MNATARDHDIASGKVERTGLGMRKSRLRGIDEQVIAGRKVDDFDQRLCRAVFLIRVHDRDIGPATAHVTVVTAVADQVLRERRAAPVPRDP